MSEDKDKVEPNEALDKPTKDNINPDDSVVKLLESMFNPDDEAFAQGLKNLSELPESCSKTNIVRGKSYEDGVIGFRRTGRNLTLAIAGGKALVRYIDLEKFIVMVEKMHDPDSSTILLKNYQDQDEYKGGRGQELGRINPKCSAIQVMQGLCGRVIKSPSDLAAHDVYYIPRKDLTSFYLAAKSQISTENTLESLISAFDGWKQFRIPLDPMNPYEVE